MTETPVRTHEQSIIIEATPEAIYDLVSDITRTGEWSPVCTACCWDDAGEAGPVGVWFTGHNELPGRTWETRSQIAAADRGREFAWIVGGSFVRWGFTFDPGGAVTKLTESWDFLPSGIAMFQEKYGDRAAAEIDERTRQAHDGIPRTRHVQDRPTGSPTRWALPVAHELQRAPTPRRHRLPQIGLPSIRTSQRSSRIPSVARPAPRAWPASIDRPPAHRRLRRDRGKTFAVTDRRSTIGTAVPPANDARWPFLDWDGRS